MYSGFVYACLTGITDIRMIIFIAKVCHQSAGNAVLFNFG